MAGPYYLSESGSDSTGDGSQGNPWRSFAPVIAALTNPVTASVTVYLAGTVASPQSYPAASFDGVVFLGNAALIVQPTAFLLANYNGGYDPFAAANTGVLDPESAKPAKIAGAGAAALAMINGSGCIQLYGVEIDGGTGAAVLTGERSNTELRYCRIDTDGSVGVLVQGQAKALIENSLVQSAGTAGIGAFGHSLVQIAGETIIRECGQYGIVAYNDSTIEFQAWPLQPRKKFVTTIETTSPRMKYAAMFAAANSTLHIIDRGFLNDPSIAQVKILNRNLHQSDEYFGVALDSHSTLLNSKRLSFADPTINEGKDTVPDDQQIVRSPGDQCVAID
jgi:hypothetical protein